MSSNRNVAGLSSSGLRKNVRELDGEGINRWPVESGEKGKLESGDGV